jgi:hypothetical protein
MTFILIEIYNKYFNFCFRRITQSTISSPAFDDEFADAKFIKCPDHRFLTCSLFYRSLCYVVITSVYHIEQLRLFNVNKIFTLEYDFLFIA